MRKILLTLCFTMCIVFSFTACGSSSSAWFYHDEYRCRIDYEDGTVSFTANSDEVALISFTLTEEAGLYYCEVIFPDGKSYWEKTNSTESWLVGNPQFSKVGEDYGYSEGYNEVAQIISGDDLVDKIIENYVEVEQTTVSFPIGRIFLAIVVGLVGLWQVCAPESAWFMNRGWWYKNAEPSEAGLAMTRASGVLVMILAVIVVMVSCAG